MQGTARELLEGWSAYVILGNELRTSALHHCNSKYHQPHDSVHVIAIIDRKVSFSSVCKSYMLIDMMVSHLFISMVI
jgi:hypothetical protein